MSYLSDARHTVRLLWCAFAMADVGGDSSSNSGDEAPLDLSGGGQALAGSSQLPPGAAAEPRKCHDVDSEEHIDLSAGSSTRLDSEEHVAKRQRSIGSDRGGLRKVHEQAQCFEWAMLSLRLLLHLIPADGLWQKFFNRHWKITTHFSGLGTVDVALEMIRSAFQAVAHFKCFAEVVSSCEIIPSLQSVLVQRSPGACVLQDIFERVQANRGEDSDKYRQLLLNALVARCAKCVSHRGMCAAARHAHLNVSGSSCRPWSSANRSSRRKAKHNDMNVFYAWARLMREDLPYIIIHENVLGFDQSVLEAELGHLYEIVGCFDASPAQVGFGFIRRPRRYHVLVLRDSGIVLPRLREIHDASARALAAELTSWPQMVWRAHPDELRAELAAAARSRHRSVEPTGWSELLTEPQRRSLAGFEARWLNHYQRSAKHFPECVFDLGDTPDYKTGLPSTSALPTARRRAAVWWSPHHERWMLAREKAACMGFPVYEDLAKRAKVPEDLLTVEHAAAVGNAMHVANVGMVMLATMAAAEWPKSTGSQAS